MMNQKHEKNRNSITVCSHGTIHIHLSQTSIHMPKEEFLAFARTVREMAKHMEEWIRDDQTLITAECESVH